MIGQSLPGKKTDKSRRTKMLVNISVVLGVFACLIACVIIFAFPSLDREICLTRTATKIGTRPTYAGIRLYIEQYLISGISRDQSLKILRGIAPVKIVESQTVPDNLVRDTYQVQMCLFPLNNIIVLVYYDEFGNLDSISVVTDFP